MLNPQTHTGKQMADLQTRIQFLEADKRVQDLLIVARDAEIERLRYALSNSATTIHITHSHGKAWISCDNALCVEARVVLEQK